MVEFALLFALGFLTALLLALFIAPAIHGRVVKFTENRLRATVPMSAAELKAARDMERAAYAVENRRVSMELKTERDKISLVAGRADEMNAMVAKMRGENINLVQQIDILSVEAGDLRSKIRKEELRADNLKASLGDAERSVSTRSRQVDDLRNELRSLTIDFEDMKIDIATRDTEVESLKLTVETLGDERRRLRDDLKASQTKANDLDYRFQREETRNASLEQKLAETISKLSDQESLLERRGAETERLKDKLKTTSKDLKEAQSSLKALERERRALEARLSRTGRGSAGDDMAPRPLLGAEPVAATELPSDEAIRNEDGVDKNAISQRVDKLRARHAALVERLMNAKDDRSDGALRKEIKEIAAAMVSLTAAREGHSSPIRTILSGEDTPSTAADQPSLATRASALINDD